MSRVERLALVALATCLMAQDESTMKETHKMNTMKKPQKIALGVSGGVAGAVGPAAALATDLSPVLMGLLAGLLSALLGAIAFMITLRVVGE